MTGSSQIESANPEWSYAASVVDSIGINFEISRPLMKYAVNQSSSTATPQVAHLRVETSSHSVRIGWNIGFLVFCFKLERGCRIAALVVPRPFLHLSLTPQLIVSKTVN
jgi:hypothetical protein